MNTTPHGWHCTRSLGPTDKHVFRAASGICCFSSVRYASVREPRSSTYAFDLAQHQYGPACRLVRGCRRGRGIQVASLLLLSSVACCGAQGEHVAETFLVEPPNWERTDNWRPPASPGTTFYWHDRSWAPECPWDIGRLTKKTLEAPVRLCSCPAGSSPQD